MELFITSSAGTIHSCLILIFHLFSHRLLARATHFPLEHQRSEMEISAITAHRIIEDKCLCFTLKSTQMRLIRNHWPVTPHITHTHTHYLSIRDKALHWDCAAGRVSYCFNVAYEVWLRYKILLEKSVKQLWVKQTLHRHNMKKSNIIKWMK